MDFVSLHHHTTMSKGDGHGSPLKHVARAHELGMTAIGGTEHGNISSGVQYEKACDKYGLKFIPGVEAYGSPTIRDKKYQQKTHQTILAITDEGYQNLNKIVTQSYRDFYQYPTVSWESLKGHSDGLVVTSGCASSLTSCKLLGGKFYGPEREEYTNEQFESVLRVLRQYKKVFGDRYYLEVQRFPDLDRICTINQALERASSILGIPLLATADVHYCYESEAHIQQALHAGHRGSTVAETGENWEYDIPLTHPESDQEIIDDLTASGLTEDSARQAVENTAVIAERAKIRLPKSTPLKFPLPEGMYEAEEYLNEQIAEGIEYRAAYGKLCDGPDYQARIEHEMKVIRLKPEFIDYFLFLSDLICWAKDNGIFVGPGRGSAAASLVCYLLRITEIDPMTVPTMVFERFMDASRTDPPDIDIDISDEDRYKLVDYLKAKYGDDNVGNVANIIHYKGVSALKKVGIIYRIPQTVLKPLKERIENRTEEDARRYDTIVDAIDRYAEDPEIKSILERFPEAIKVASEIEGDVETFGSHAAGYVVSDRPIPEVCALYSKESDSGFDPSMPRQIPYDKRDAEYLNMLKADLLGLATCGMIDKSIETVNQLKRDALVSGVLTLHDIYAMTYDDQEILGGFREDDLTGIFQFEGGTTRGICKRVQPDSILDLSDINALSRPGPLFSGAVDRYIDAKHGVIEVDSIHELYDQHVTETYGQLVYQEQIMKVLRDVAGFDTQKVLRVRKIIGKKLGEHQFAELWDDFKTGCAKTAGIDEDSSWRIWGTITTAAGYAFCVTGDTVLEKGGSGGNDPDKTVTIAELYARQESKTPIGKKIRSGKLHLLGMDDDGRIRPQTLLKIHAPVLAPCLKFTVESGRTITVSTQHQFLTDSGYVVAEDISLSDSLIMDSGWKARDDERIESLTKRRHGAYRPLGESWSGAGNPGWIDGRTALWESAKIAVASRSGNMCEECGKPDDGSKHCLEFSHIMGLEAALGNYDLYHSEHNVRHLCNSCHKKFDYRFQKTRVKRWAKGRPTTSERVVSIEDAGRQHVYDVSIAEDCHNYIGNGFVNHNNIAHSYSYSVIAYWTMYFKKNHPEAFYAASLAKNGDGKDDIPRRTKLLQDLTLHGRNIEVESLSAAYSKQNWTVEYNDGAKWLTPGFLQVSGIGEKTADLLVATQRREIEFFNDFPANANKDIDDFLSFETLVKETKGVGPAALKAMKSLAEAEDPFGVNRVSKQLSAFRAQLEDGEFEGHLPDAGEFYTSAELEGFAEPWEVVTWVGLVANIAYRDAVEFERTKTGKSVEEILESMEEPSLVKHAVLFCYDEAAEVAIRIGRKIYPRWQSLVSQIQIDHHLVVVTGKKMPGMGNSIIPANIMVLDPD